MIYDVKLPTINPETISMLGLNLFSQLCTVRLFFNSCEAFYCSCVSVKDQLFKLSFQTPQLARHLVTEGSSAGKAMRMDQLWKIALCANNIDVSMRAVQVNLVSLGALRSSINMSFLLLWLSNQKYIFRS